MSKLLRNACKLIKSPSPARRLFAPPVFPLGSFCKYLKSLNILVTPPPPPHRVISVDSHIRPKAVASLTFSLIFGIQNFSLILFGFFIPFAQAQVGCNFEAQARCFTNCTSFHCEGGISGFIKHDTRPKALRIQVINSKNEIIEKETLNSPPQKALYYQNPKNVNNDDWIIEQVISKLEPKGIPLGRNEIQINPEYGVVFDNSTVLYEDKDGTQRKGTLGELSRKPNKQRTVQCTYTDTAYVIRSIRCPGETSCIANLYCIIDGQPINTTAYCRAESDKKCPSPTQCILDESKHLTESIYAENLSKLRSYGIDDDQPEENKPVKMTPSWEGGSVR